MCLTTDGLKFGITDCEAQQKSFYFPLLAHCIYYFSPPESGLNYVFASAIFICVTAVNVVTTFLTLQYVTAECKAVKCYDGLFVL